MHSATELELRRWSRGLRSAAVTWLSAAIVVVMAIALWLRGAGFYALPVLERVEHVDYALLSPSRPTGRVYGAVGLALMLLNLAYLLRRRFPHWPIGRMRLWLDAHVVTGLTASLFVAFHSAFQLRSPVAMITAVTLGVTLATGVVGRFFHAFVPRCESSLSARIADLDALLPGVGKPLIEGLDKRPPSQPTAGSGVLRTLRLVPRWRREARDRRAFVLVTYAERAGSLAGLDRDYTRPLARELSLLAAREVYAVVGRELLRAWRPWHRLCALTMVGGVLLHVGVALFYGYGWDFGS